MGAEATAFLTRTSGLDGTHTAAYTTLIDGLVADGVWAKLDALWVMRTQDATTAFLNLVSSSFTCTGTIGPGQLVFTADDGISTAGTDYVETNFNPTTAPSPKFTQNDAAFFAFCLGNSTSNGGPIGAVGGQNYLYNNQNGSSSLSAFFGVNANAAYTGSGVSRSNGLFTATRLNSTTVLGFQDTLQLGSLSETSVAITSGTFRLLRTDGIAWNGTVAAAGVGGTLLSTDIRNLYARLTAYFLAIAAAVTGSNAGGSRTYGILRPDRTRLVRGGTTAPVGPVTIDQSKMPRGLELFALFNSGGAPVDLVRGRVFTAYDPAGTPAPRSALTIAGPGFDPYPNTADASSYYTSIDPKFTGGASQAVSVEAFVYYRGGGGGSVYTGVHNNNPNDGSFDKNLGVADDGAPGLYFYPGAGTGLYGASSFTPRFLHLVGVDNLTNSLLYVNGVLAATTGSGNYTSFSIPIFAIGGQQQSVFGPPNRQSNDIILHAGFATVAWSANEVRQRYEQMYDFLVPAEGEMPALYNPLPPQFSGSGFGAPYVGPIFPYRARRRIPA